MEISPLKGPENGFRKWSLAHNQPMNHDDEFGGAQPNVLTDLSRDGQSVTAIAAKVPSLP